MTGTGEYLSQVSLPELDTDLLSEDEVAFIEIHYHQLQNLTQNFSVQRGMIHTWEGRTCYAMLWRSLKGSPTVWNLLPPMPIHWCPSALEIRATNLLYKLLQSNLVDKWAALQIDHIHSTLSWLLSLIHPPEADVPHYASIHLWRAHCLIKTLCMWIPAQHMTFGFAQSPAAVWDLALPQFLSPVLPARNTLLGPA